MHAPMPQVRRAAAHGMIRKGGTTGGSDSNRASDRYMTNSRGHEVRPPHPDMAREPLPPYESGTCLSIPCSIAGGSIVCPFYLCRATAFALNLTPCQLAPQDLLLHGRMCMLLSVPLLGFSATSYSSRLRFAFPLSASLIRTYSV